MRTYSSALGKYIIGLIEQKRACGYIYEFEAYLSRTSTASVLSGSTIAQRYPAIW